MTPSRTDLEPLPMLMLPARVMLSSLILAILTACAASSVSRDEIERVHRNNAGEPVNNVFLGVGIRDWQIVGPDTIRMELSRQRHLLVDLAPPCSSVLTSVDSFALISRQSGYLSIFDQVRMGDVSCRIQTIRELDYESVREELDAG